ncbi:MAG: Crp/Fnr family transcriptional regulator [Dissulfurimicrobium sp.]|uniref:Crp/Fnr family transcriptional regulator n=1 Tax=Dissulfurimicrobium sp. TaxID=2022436 RepID=UPI00404B26DD
MSKINLPLSRQNNSKQENIIDGLSRTPLFEGLPLEKLALIASITELLRYGKGQTIFSEGDPSRGFYTVFSGRIKIFKLSPNGKEQILHIFGPGEPFGEVAVFDGINFPAYAQAMDEASVIFIPKDRFIELIAKDPALTLKMLSVLSMRLRKFTHLIEDLSLKDVPGRLAKYILLISEKGHGTCTIRLDLTKNQLAGLLGTIPETLSRIFARL